MWKARRVWIAFAAILVTAASLRLLHLKALPPGLYADEAMEGSNALWALHSHQFKVFYPENNGREGLFSNVVALAIFIFGNEPWVIRIPSVLFGIGTVAGLFFLARELFREESSQRVFGFLFEDAVAIIASFLIAVSYWHLNFSRIGFRAIAAPFFLVWAFALLFIALRRSTASNLLISSVAGFFFGLGFHTYISYRIAPILLIFPYVHALKHRKLRTFDSFLLPAFLAALPMVLYFSEHPRDFVGRIRQVSIFSSDSPAAEFFSNLGKTFAMLWFRGDANPRHNLPGSPELWPPVGILCAIGLIIAGVSIIRNKQRFAHLFVCSWLLLFSLPVALSNENIPHALRSILMLPAALLAAAFAFCFLLQRLFRRLESSQGSLHRPRWMYISVGLLVILLAGVHVAATAHQYFVRWPSRPDTFSAFDFTHAEMGRWLSTLPDEIPKYVIVKSGGVPVPLPDNSTVSYPMPAQTILFLTDTWSSANQKMKNLTYVLKDRIPDISCHPSCIIVLVEPDTAIYSALQRSIPDLNSSTKSSFTYYYKGRVVLP